MTRQEFYEKLKFLKRIITELHLGRMCGTPLQPNTVQMGVMREYMEEMKLYLQSEDDNQAIIDCCRLFPNGFSFHDLYAGWILFLMDVQDMAKERIWHLPPSDDRYFIDCNGNCFFRDCIGREPRQIPRPEYSYKQTQTTYPQPLALMTAHPDTAAQPPAEQPTDTAQPAAEPRKPGRPKGTTATLADRLIGDEQERAETLKKLHRIIDGKKGRDVALAVYACVQAGKMNRPTFAQLQTEFGEIGAYSGYNSYFREEWRFSDEEIARTIAFFKG